MRGKPLLKTIPIVNRKSYLVNMLALLKALFYSTAALFILLCLPFVVIHVAEHWDDPIYPYSGFTPDCPTWEEPSEKPSIVNRQW